MGRFDCRGHRHPRLRTPVSRDQVHEELAELYRQAGLAGRFFLSWPDHLGHTHERNTRRYAQVLPAHPPRFELAPQTVWLPAAHRRALLAHEVGHVLDPHGSEDDADRAARKRLGVKIGYDHRFPGKGLQVARNPDDSLRSREREAAGGSPEERVRLAYTRRRAGHHVEPWELNPISYVLIDSWLSLLTDKPIKAELAYNAVTTVGGVQQGGEFEKKIAGYVYPARFPYTRQRLPLDELSRLGFGLDQSHLQQLGYEEQRALEQRVHLAVVEHAVSLGAVRVILPFSETVRETYEDPSRQDYRDFYDAYRVRVLTITPDIRVAKPKNGEGWGGRDPNPVIPDYFVRARLMRKTKGGAWKNPPEQYLDMLASGSLTPEGLRRMISRAEQEVDDARFFKADPESIRHVERQLADMRAAATKADPAFQPPARARLAEYGQEILKDEAEARKRAEADRELMGTLDWRDARSRRLAGAAPPAQGPVAAPPPAAASPVESHEAMLQRQRLVEVRKKIAGMAFDLRDARRFDPPAVVKKLEQELAALQAEEAALSGGAPATNPRQRGEVRHFHDGRLEKDRTACGRMVYGQRSGDPTVRPLEIVLVDEAVTCQACRKARSRAKGTPGRGARWIR